MKKKPTNFNIIYSVFASSLRPYRPNVSQKFLGLVLPHCLQHDAVINMKFGLIDFFFYSVLASSMLIIFLFFICSFVVLQSMGNMLAKVRIIQQYVQRRVVLMNTPSPILPRSSSQVVNQSHQSLVYPYHVSFCSNEHIIFSLSFYQKK